MNWIQYIKELLGQHQFHKEILPATPRLHQRFYESATVLRKAALGLPLPFSVVLVAGNIFNFSNVMPR